MRETNIDRLLKARAAIDERARHVEVALTIMFTDVVGATTRIERVGHATALAALHQHAQMAAATISKFKGRVIRTMDGSVMAEFQEPRAAVRAAVVLQQGVLGLNHSLPTTERLYIRVGINSGPAFRGAGDVFGNAVRLAARITNLAGPAQILIGSSVRQAILQDPETQCVSFRTVSEGAGAETDHIFELIWLDAASYRRLREDVAGAFDADDSISTGARLQDLVTGVASGLGEEPTAERSARQLPTSISARYEILGELGRGGMGIVCKARDRETSELVALKMLQAEIAADGQAMERFKNELRLARKITHKNVCRIYEFHRAEGTAFISMEYVDGESLQAILKRFGGVSIRKGIQIALQVCAGLREAHAQGVVHRDLKPGNIMIDRAGNVKIMDFGIARSLHVAGRTSGGIVGTPAYMAPEQAEGRNVDLRADIYALGLLLYEMLTGTPAFAGDTPVAVALKQIRDEPRRPRELEPGLPAAIEQAILKCLAKKPDGRFASVDEFEAALAGEPEARPEASAAPPPATPLEAALTPQPEPVPAPPTPLAPRRPWITRPAVWMISMTCALVLASAVLLFIYRSEPRSPNPPPAPGPVEAPAHSDMQARVKDLLDRGDTFFEAGEYDSAILLYDSALTLSPTDQQAKQKLARARSSLEAEWKVLRRQNRQR